MGSLLMWGWPPCALPVAHRGVCARNVRRQGRGWGDVEGGRRSGWDPERGVQAVTRGGSAALRVRVRTWRELVSLLVWRCVFVCDWKPLEGGAAAASYRDTAPNIRSGF